MATEQEGEEEEDEEAVEEAKLYNPTSDHLPREAREGRRARLT